MARRKPGVSPRAVPPNADDVVVPPRPEVEERRAIPPTDFDPLDDPPPDDDEEDEPSEEEEPIGDEPESRFSDDRAPRHAQFIEGPEPDDSDFAWPGGPRSAGHGASAGLGEVPTFDPEHPPLPRVPLVADRFVGGADVRPSYGNGHGGYDERPERFQQAAPQQSMGGPVPMWPDQADFAPTTQVIVKRRESDGSLANLGPFPKDATIDMVLTKYPTPGVFFVFPIDGMGREFDPRNPTRIDIPDDYEFFTRKKKIDAMSPTGQAIVMAGGGNQVVAPEFMSLIEKIMAQKDAEAARLAEEVKRREDALAQRELELRDLGTKLAVREIEHITTASKDLLTVANGQFAGVIAMLQTMNQTTLQQQEAAADRERIRLEASHKAALEQSAQMSKLMFEQFTSVTKMHTDVAERERERDKAALEAEKTRLAEETKLRATFMSAEEKRRQDVFATQQAQEKKGGLSTLSDTLETYKKLKEMMGGTEPGEGEGGKAWWETAAEMFSEAQRMKHEMRIEKLRARAGYPQGVPLPPDLMDDDDDEDSDDVPAVPQQQALRGPVRGQVPMPPQGWPQQQAPAAPPPFAGLGAPMPATLNQAVPPPAQAGPPAVQQPVQSLAAPGAAPPVAAFDPSFADAKRMTQMTIDRLAQTPNREAWGDLVASAIIAVPSMLDYFRAETVYGAMMENGADPALADEVCNAAAQIAAQNGIPVR